MRERSTISLESEKKRGKSRKIARSLVAPITVVALAGGLSACHTEETSNSKQNCFEYRGVYDPTPDYSNTNNYNGDEFYSTTSRICLPKDKDPKSYTCPDRAVITDDYAIEGVLLPNTCETFKK